MEEGMGSGFWFGTMNKSLIDVIDNESCTPV